MGWALHILLLYLLTLFSQARRGEHWRRKAPAPRPPPVPVCFCSVQVLLAVLPRAQCKQRQRRQHLLMTGLPAPPASQVVSSAGSGSRERLPAGPSMHTGLYLVQLEASSLSIGLQPHPPQPCLSPALGTSVLACSFLSALLQSSYPLVLFSPH